MSTTAVQLREALTGMTARLASIIRDVKVEYSNTQGGGMISMAPKYNWKKRNAGQTATLHSIKREYEEWIEQLRSIFRRAPNDVECKIQNADMLFRMWLEFEENWSLTSQAHKNEAKFRSNVSEFNHLLDILDSATAVGIIIIPDTNSIVGHPDPTDYRGLAGNDGFTFLLLPTVLSELDELKNLHQNPDFRDKAKRVITRIKGWRMQGSLRDGVIVNSTITVRAIANDPDMKHSLSWLDPEIKDDRIIASVLEVQAANPSDQVVLVTGDINLLNKAATARINHAEI